MTERKDYYIGLDPGTGDAGWSVTDTKYDIIRKKGKDMWGVRLFNEADTAKDRRKNRTARRNSNREKIRNAFLKEIFEDEIKKFDPGFYERLKESKYYLEDKEIDTPFVLFSDTGYTDADYYREYPTAFHLISELLSDKGKEPHDVRLVFLACLNIFKHRGHFLNENLSGDGIGDVGNICSDLAIQYSEYYTNMNSETSFIFDKDKIKTIFEDVLKDKHKSASAKKSAIIKALALNNDFKNVIEMINLVCGLTATVGNIFPKDTYDEEQKKQKLCFKSSNLDETLEKVAAMLTDEEYDIILTLMKIYEWGVISVIMGSHKYISQARVESYEKHKKDLGLLKNIYKEYCKDKYDSMFRDMSNNNYSAYVGKVSSNKASQSGNHKTRMQRRGARCNRNEFYKRVKDDLKNVPDEVKKDILADIETDLFLPKQLTNENGIIPYQLHRTELRKILDNASEYLDFLNVVDETGLSKKQQILDVFEFRIPYYIGPLFNNPNADTNAWVIRKEGGKVFPWNFSEKIDEKASAELFIEKMVRHCTYLNDECVLPFNSLKYEKFRVLNELNNLRIDGKRVDPEIKQRIYNELFKVSKKRISKAVLCKYLYENGIADKGVEVSGFDKTFANALLTYGKFREVFGVDTLTDKQERAAEDIVRWSTIYGNSKKFLKEKITENYGPDSNMPILDAKQIERIMGYKFKDWGKLSKEFLELEGADKETGVVLPLITRMWKENSNLMELLSDRYTYKEELAQKTQKIEKTLTDIEYDDLRELCVSSPVKRMIWQTLLLVKEICGIMGYPPKKIFIEMARCEEEKKNGKGERKSSRKKRLEDLYKNAKKADKELIKGIKNCSEDALQSKKLYLYYMQKGRCMYSGHAIDLNNLFTNSYDIDHIYPQSIIKDDSLDNNMVLVEKNMNQNKKNHYPLNRDWQNNMKEYWATLRDEGFLNAEKYKRLTRTEELTDYELADFVNRQLVETRQATKVLAELISRSFTDATTGEKLCRVVYAKAKNVSDFRHEFSMKYDKNTGKSQIIHPELVKCRQMNDFHHAYDAYLNIVVGNVYDVKFTQNPYNYIKEYKKQKNDNSLSEKEKEHYHMDKIFNFDVKRGNEIAWIRNGENNTLDTVLKVMRKNTPIITRMSYEAHGAFSDLTIWNAEKAKNGTGYISTKSSDERMDKNRYGGFSTLTTTCFFLVEHTKKGKRIRTIEAIPLYLRDKLNSKEKLEKWCADSNGLGLVDPSVRLERIKIRSKIRIDGFDLCLTGKSGNSLLTSNEVQFKSDPYWRYYIKKLSEYEERQKIKESKRNKGINENKENNDSEDIIDSKDSKDNEDSRITPNSEDKIINVKDNIRLYDIILKKNTEEIFSKRPNTIGKILLSGKDKFIQLSVSEQVSSLINMLKVFSFENNGFDLTSIGGGAFSGKMSLNKNISDRESVILINQSVTGFYENRIDLLKV